jgi:lipopolysaccharide transport system permease protein
MSPAATATEGVLIQPPRGWSDLGLRELWNFRELLYFLTKRELQIRYKQSLFGIAWAVLQPLTLAFIFALFFGKLAGIEIPGDTPFAVFAIAGLVPYLFMAQAISQTAGSLVADASLLSKVYFPRLAIPLAKTGGLMLDLAIALVVVFVVIAAYGAGVSGMVWLVPAFLALGIVTAFSLGTLFASINVKYRDVALVVPMFVQIMLFVTPVVYPSTLVTGNWQYVYSLNPMVSVVDGIRWALLGQPAPLVGEVAASVGAALLLLVVAILYFRRTEQFFADVV